MLTIETAIAYVIQTETSWGLCPTIESAETDGDCINVRTADNQWSVWIEADGIVDSGVSTAVGATDSLSVWVEADGSLYGEM